MLHHWRIDRHDSLVVRSRGWADVLRVFSDDICCQHGMDVCTHACSVYNDCCRRETMQTTSRHHREHRLRHKKRRLDRHFMTERIATSRDDGSTCRTLHNKIMDSKVFNVLYRFCNAPGSYRCRVM